MPNNTRNNNVTEKVVLPKKIKDFITQIQSFPVYTYVVKPIEILDDSATSQNYQHKIYSKS